MGEEKIKDITIEIIYNEIQNSRQDNKDLRQDIKEFRDDAEIKIDNTRTILKKEVKLRFDTLKEDVNELKTRFDKIEEKNEILQNHQFQLDKLNKDVNNLNVRFKNDIDLINKVINTHLEIHQKEEPKRAVNNFKLASVLSLVALIEITFITAIIGVFVKNFNKIITFISKIFT